MVGGFLEFLKVSLTKLTRKPDTPWEKRLLKDQLSSEFVLERT